MIIKENTIYVTSYLPIRFLKSFIHAPKTYKSFET